MRLRPLDIPSENTIRVQVAEQFEELLPSLRANLSRYPTKRMSCSKPCQACDLGAFARLTP